MVAPKEAAGLTTLTNNPAMWVQVLKASLHHSPHITSLMTVGVGSLWPSTGWQQRGFNGASLQTSNLPNYLKTGKGIAVIGGEISRGVTVSVLFSAVALKLGSLMSVIKDQDAETPWCITMKIPFESGAGVYFV